MSARTLADRIVVSIVVALALLLPVSCSPSSSSRDIESRNAKSRDTESRDTKNLNTENRNTEVSSSERTIEVRPLNYRFREYKEGWNIGFVRMYLINTSQNTLSSSAFALQNASVETAEGKTYPVEIFSFWRTDVELYSGDPYAHSGSIRELGWPQQIRVGNSFPLVAGFPIIPLDEDGAHYVFVFRFAKAATPAKMDIRTSSGSVSFDLSNVEGTVPSPNPTSESLADFANLVSQDNDSVEFSLEDTCTYDSNCKFSISYALTNKDKFDETHFTIPGGYAVYYAGGGTVNWPNWSIVDETIGPDQTIQGAFDFSQFWGCSPLYLIYYEDETTTRVYQLSCSEQ